MPSNLCLSTNLTVLKIEKNAVLHKSCCDDLEQLDGGKDVTILETKRPQASPQGPRPCHLDQGVGPGPKPVKNVRNTPKSSWLNSSTFSIFQMPRLMEESKPQRLHSKAHIRKTRNAQKYTYWDTPWPPQASWIVWKIKGLHTQTPWLQTGRPT